MDAPEDEPAKRHIPGHGRAIFGNGHALRAGGEKNPVSVQ